MARCRFRGTVNCWGGGGVVARSEEGAGDRGEEENATATVVWKERESENEIVAATVRVIVVSVRFVVGGDVNIQ